MARAAPPSEQTLACVSASTQGQVERDRGHLLAARAQLRSCAQPACPSIVRKSCADWLADLDSRIPSVVVRVIDPGERDLTEASVQIDGSAVVLDGRPVALDPGAHDVVVSAPGWPGVERTLLLAEREQARLLVIELAPAPQPAPPPRTEVRPRAAPEPVAQREPGRARAEKPFRVPVGSWVLGGLGVVGIGTFAVLRVEAGRELDRLQECSPTCDPAKSEPGRHLALGADISLGIGVAALAGAGAWALGSWLWHDRRSTRVAFTPTRGGIVAALAARY
jgi:hypothetical protein